MSKDKDKRLEEKEKWDAEGARSLSVVELKKAHKQIEDFEKIRKHDAIKSIIDRLLSLGSFSEALYNSIERVRKKSKYNIDENPVEKRATKLMTSFISMYESIRLDLQRNIDVNKEDFDRLFPKVEIDMSNYSRVQASLFCLRVHLCYMLDYTQRLL